MIGMNGRNDRNSQLQRIFDGFHQFLSYPFSFYREGATLSRQKEPMRKIKEVLRLAELDALGERQIARGTNMKKSTVHDYLLRIQQAKITWSIAQQMNDDELDRLLFPAREATASKKTLPDWDHIHKELRRKHVTLQLLWEEYREAHTDGLGYSRFCELYRDFSGTVDLSMRQTHKAGEKVFLDYSGSRVPIIDARTGEEKEAEIFIAVFGASNYTYVEGTWSQQIPDRIGSHVRAFMFFGGVPAQLVPDNLKTGVTKAGYYDPEINPTYQRFAEHYGVAVIPARAAHPKDKAKVEAGVLIVQRWIIAKLRNRTFFSLPELNETLAELLIELNEHPFKKMAGSRKTLFDAVDKPALRPLPSRPYEFDEWKKATVNIDYHVSFDEHYYSVPYKLVQKTISIRATNLMIEVFYKGTRVASHQRSYQKYRHTTIAEHMPPSHRWHAEWTPDRLVEWGRKSGADVAALFDEIMKSRLHPEQGFRACMGIKRLGEKVGNIRLNAACQRALAIGGKSYKCVRNILERGQENAPLPSEQLVLSIHHDNVRGAGYYRESQQEESYVASSHD
jgi:transposase